MIRSHHRGISEVCFTLSIGWFINIQQILVNDGQCKCGFFLHVTLYHLTCSFASLCSPSSQISTATEIGFFSKRVIQLAETSQNPNEFEFAALDTLISAVNDGDENKTWSRITHKIGILLNFPCIYFVDSLFNGIWRGATVSREEATGTICPKTDIFIQALAHLCQ